MEIHRSFDKIVNHPGNCIMCLLTSAINEDNTQFPFRNVKRFHSTFLLRKLLFQNCFLAVIFSYNSFLEANNNTFTFCHFPNSKVNFHQDS